MIAHRQALINQEQTDTEIDKISQALDLIFNSQTKRISFQKIYHSVYKLCRQGLHQELADLAIKKVTYYFQTIISQQKLNSTSIGQSLSETISNSMEIIQRILEVFLYLEANHRQRQGAASLRIIFNNILFESITKRQQLMKMFVMEIAKQKLIGNIDSAKKMISLISNIDQNERFISSAFLPAYIPQIRDHFILASRQRISSNKLNEYLQWAINMIKLEKQFMASIVSRSKVEAKQEFDSVINEVYDIIVTKQKKKIYLIDPKRLFSEDTPLILQLFNSVNGKDIQQHIQWYTGVVKAELTALNRTHNQQFLQNFIRFYQKVKEYLSNTTKNFTINYKVKFIFEEWINEERINLPYRLNIYINNSLTESPENKENTHFFSSNQLSKNSQTPENIKFIHNCQILFKLLKKKDQFEKCYRKMIIKRRIKNQNNEFLQQKLISIMTLECGEEWVLKIQNLRNSVKEFNNSNTMKKNKSKIDVIAFEEIAWPYEKENFNSLIAKQLMEMANQYQKKFVSNDPKKKIKFHPTLGQALISIKFLNGQVRDFIMDTCQANMMLYLKKQGKMKIEEFTKQNYFTIQQIKEPFKKLLKNSLLICDQKNYLRLNENFLSNWPQNKGNLPIDMTEQENEDSVESVQMQELKADRKLMVEAMIIKIMKASKTAGRQQIMKKIVPVIESRGFKFNREFVDQSIERLLDKQFLRDFNDGTLGYIA